ncbi:MAG: amino acid ABC transporter permease [Clostridia bacterium]|nr:amino acid ABC transporter permease [Clostridia bacterium]
MKGNIFETLLPFFLPGIKLTIIISFSAILISLITGLFLGLMYVSKNKVIHSIACIYIKIFRNTPFMVQVYLIYFGLRPVLGLQNFSAAVIGTAALALYTTAYVAVILESGLRSVPKGQYESAEVLNIPYFTAFFRIILPQVFTVIIPSLTGQLIMTVKESSVLTVISVAELTNKTYTATNETAIESFEIFIAAGCVYWAINLIIEIISKLAEKRASKYQLQGGR